MNPAAQTPLAISRTSNLSPLPAPVLSLDSAVGFPVHAALVSPDAILTSGSETPCHKENSDPFLVKSPHPPSRGDHVATATAPSSLSYEIEAWNLLRKLRPGSESCVFVQIGPGSADEIEVTFSSNGSRSDPHQHLSSQEIMVISSNKTLPQISTPVI